MICSYCKKKLARNFVAHTLTCMQQANLSTPPSSPMQNAKDAEAAEEFGHNTDVILRHYTELRKNKVQNS